MRIVWLKLRVRTRGRTDDGELPPLGLDTDFEAVAALGALDDVVLAGVSPFETVPAGEALKRDRELSDSA